MDKTFQESLGNFQESPPQEVWSGITETLNEDLRKSRIAWIGRIAASAVLLLAAGSVWMVLQLTPESEIGRSEIPEQVPEQPLPESISGESGKSGTDLPIEESTEMDSGSGCWVPI